MYNRLEVESAILELKDLTVLTNMIHNNTETINSVADYASLFSIVADILTNKVNKLQNAFYGNPI